jgi:hypothetical protein
MSETTGLSRHDDMVRSIASKIMAGNAAPADFQGSIHWKKKAAS